MKASTFSVTTLSVILSLGSLSAFAQRGRGGGAGMGHGGPNASARTNTPAGDRSTKPGRSSDTPRMAGDKKVGDQLARNTQLSSRLQGLLPVGTDISQASSGFKNLGQFVAAAHVSRNLNIPFDQLKAKMTGMSLGKAIHELNPDVDAKAEAKKAEQQAKQDIQASKAEAK